MNQKISVEVKNKTMTIKDSLQNKIKKYLPQIEKISSIEKLKTNIYESYLQNRNNIISVNKNLHARE